MAIVEVDFLRLLESHEAMKRIVSNRIEFVDGLSIEGLLADVLSIDMGSVFMLMKLMDHALSFMDSFGIEREERTMLGEALMSVELVDDIVELCLADGYFFLFQKIFNLADTGSAMLGKVANDGIFGRIEEEHWSFSNKSRKYYQYN